MPWSQQPATWRRGRNNWAHNLEACWRILGNLNLFWSMPSRLTQRQLVATEDCIILKLSGSNSGWKNLAGECPKNLKIKTFNSCQSMHPITKLSLLLEPSLREGPERPIYLPIQPLRQNVGAVGTNCRIITISSNYLLFLPQCLFQAGTGVTMGVLVRLSEMQMA